MEHELNMLDAIVDADMEAENEQDRLDFYRFVFVAFLLFAAYVGL